MAWSELAFHAFSVCRFAEELQQMQRVGMSKYISSGWNQIDLATSFLVLAAGLLRLTLVSSIEGELGASVDAWRRSEVALSQWEPSDRGATMCEANKLVEELAGMRSKLMLDKLLKSTEKASKGQPFWFKRSEDMDTPAEQIGKNWAYKSPLRELGL